MEREKERKQGIQLGASLWFGHKDGDQFCAGSYDKDIVRETCPSNEKQCETMNVTWKD